MRFPAEQNAGRFPAKKRWHSPPPIGLPWDSPPPPPEGRTGVRWRHNQNFSHSVPWSFAGAHRARELRYSRKATMGGVQCPVASK